MYSFAKIFLACKFQWKFMQVFNEIFTNFCIYLIGIMTGNHGVTSSVWLCVKYDSISFKLLHMHDCHDNATFVATFSVLQFKMTSDKY